MHVAKKELWPPDHRLVNVGLRVDVGEACCGRAAVSLAVYSDEPADGLGDGDTPVDARIAAPDLYLRQERSGQGDGRVYLIAATATHQGVSSTRCTTVVVPKSNSKRDRDRVKRQACAARAFCGVAGGPPGFHLVGSGSLVGANQPPAVDAGPDQAIDLGATAALHGTVTDDGLPSGERHAGVEPGRRPRERDLHAARRCRDDRLLLGCGTLPTPPDRGRLGAPDERRGRRRGFGGERGAGGRCRPRCVRRAAGDLDDARGLGERRRTAWRRVEHRLVGRGGTGKRDIRDAEPARDARDLRSDRRLSPAPRGERRAVQRGRRGAGRRSTTSLRRPSPSPTPLSSRAPRARAAASSRFRSRSPGSDRCGSTTSPSTAPPPTPATTSGASGRSSSRLARPPVRCSSPWRATTPRKATRRWSCSWGIRWRRRSAASGPS